MIVIKLIFESFRFAWAALRQNLLRTTLSLLGVTIGIFAIIAVFTLVDSLEKSIKSSLSFLDARNLEIRRFPYDFGPDIPWWEYIKRPYTNYEEYEFLRKNLKNSRGITIFSINNVTAKRQSNSSNGITLLGVAYGHKDVYDDFPDLEGRYFTEQECAKGKNVAIISHRSKKELFNGQNPIGKVLSIKGLKFTVIETIKEQGAGLFGETSKDENIYIPYFAFRKMFFSGRNSGVEPYISVKGDESDIGLVALSSEITGLLRTKRGLSPRVKDYFSVNRQGCYHEYYRLNFRCDWDCRMGNWRLFHSGGRLWNC